MPVDPGVALAALESWDWLDLRGAEPLFASRFGDVFLRRGAEVWRTDVVDFTFDPVCEAAHLDVALADPQFQSDVLLGELVDAAVRAGIDPAPGQILSFRLPPVLGGELTVANLEVFDFEVGVHLAGQIWSQVKDLPSGTPINGFTLGPLGS